MAENWRKTSPDKVEDEKLYNAAIRKAEKENPAPVLVDMPGPKKDNWVRWAEKGGETVKYKVEPYQDNKFYGHYLPSHFKKTSIIRTKGRV